MRIPTRWALRLRRLCPIRYQRFQGANHPIFPGVDVILIGIEAFDQVDHLLDGHTQAEHAGDQFGVVPIFLVEAAAEAFDGHAVAVAIHELEVVAVAAIFTFGFIDPARFYVGWQLEGVDSGAGENLIWTTFQQADYGDPLLVVVHEAHNFGFQAVGALGVVRFSKLGVAIAVRRLAIGTFFALFVFFL